MPEISFRVNAVTVGSTGCKFEHLSGGYVYGGNKRGDEEIVTSASGAESSAARKRRRLEKLAELNAVDPPLSLSEKARRMQLSPKTVSRYLKELESRP